MNNLISKGRIGHGGGHHDWVSRDYYDIDCRAYGCMFNRGGKCDVPSICAIGDDGKCKGFQPKPPPKVEGD